MKKYRGIRFTGIPRFMRAQFGDIVSMTAHKRPEEIEGFAQEFANDIVGRFPALRHAAKTNNWLACECIEDFNQIDFYLYGKLHESIARNHGILRTQKARPVPIPIRLPITKMMVYTNEASHAS